LSNQKNEKERKPDSKKLEKPCSKQKCEGSLSGINSTTTPKKKYGTKSKSKTFQTLKRLYLRNSRHEIFLEDNTNIPYTIEKLGKAAMSPRYFAKIPKVWTAGS